MIMTNHAVLCINSLISSDHQSIPHDCVLMSSEEMDEKVIGNLWQGDNWDISTYNRFFSCHFGHLQVRQPGEVILELTRNDKQH